MTVRKSYTLDFKRRVCIECIESSQKKICEKYGLDPRMVRRWNRNFRNDAENFVFKGTGRRLEGGGRKPIMKHLEDVIFDWICDRRSRSLVVRRKDIISFAVRLYFELENEKIFKGSASWLGGFMERYNLSLRRSTTLFKIPDESIVTRALAFKSYIDESHLDKYDPAFVIAMDETAVYFGEETQSTVDMKGSTSISVPSTGYESHRITCILAIKRNGEKVMPLVIAKGKSNNIIIKNGIMLVESEKAWGTQQVIQKWIERVFSRIFMGNKRGMLIWDSASTHRALNMKQFVSSRNIDQIIIPSGTTGYLQSLDIVINKPFKDYLREEINSFIEFRQQRNIRGNLIKPKIEEVISWVKNSWDKISASTVEKALISGYLFPNQSFKETAIYRHERFHELIASSLETDKNKKIVQ